MSDCATMVMIMPHWLGKYVYVDGGISYYVLTFQEVM